MGADAARLLEAPAQYHHYIHSPCPAGKSKSRCREAGATSYQQDLPSYIAKGVGTGRGMISQNSTTGQKQSSLALMLWW